MKDAWEKTRGASWIQDEGKMPFKGDGAGIHIGMNV